MKKSDLAIEHTGHLLVLLSSDEERLFTLTRCNARGESPVVVEVTGLPTETANGSSFRPSAITCRDRFILLRDTESGWVAVVDRSGRCIEMCESKDDYSHTSNDHGTVVVAKGLLAGRQTIPRRLKRALSTVLHWITKSSSSCNETDSAKSPYSVNGMWIGRYGN